MKPLSTVFRLPRKISQIWYYVSHYIFTKPNHKMEAKIQDKILNKILRNLSKLSNRYLGAIYYIPLSIVKYIELLK